MSRRHNRTEDYTELDTTTETMHSSVAWTDLMGPSWPGLQWWQWQDAWSLTTLRVTEQVWRRQGNKLYAVHRDRLLKDDLHSWLLVEAQRIANRFSPDPWHRDPEDHWAGSLNNMLTKAARWHFGDVVGSIDKHTRAEAVLIHQAGGLVSTDFLDDLEDEDGTRTERHPLHGHDLMQRDPAVIVIHLEDLARENLAIERYLRINDSYGVTTRVPAGGTCYVNLCTRPAKNKGMCRQHYMIEWRATSEIPCNIPDCALAHKSRGLCDKHLSQHRDGRLPADLEQYVETQPRPTSVPREKVERTCLVAECDRVATDRGMCQAHYKRRRKAEVPDCSIDGCTSPADASRGWCNAHYKRWLKNGTTELPSAS